MEEEETEPEETPAVDRTDMKPVTLANQIDDCVSRIETDTDDAGLRIELADLYMRSGKFRESTQAYLEAIDLGRQTRLLAQLEVGRHVVQMLAQPVVQRVFVGHRRGRRFLTHTFMESHWGIQGKDGEEPRGQRGLGSVL